MAKAIVRMRLRRFAVTIGAGILVLLAMQHPMVEASMLGDPDRAMVNMAFKLRADLFSGDGDPVLFIDFDDRTTSQASDSSGWPRAPEARTNRLLLSQILEFIRTAPPQVQAGAVMLDVDLATHTPDDPGELAAIRNELIAWSNTPGAPLLVMARQSFPAKALNQPGNALVLPATDYDDIVAGARNIFYGSVKMLADKDGIVGDFAPYECVRTPNGVEPLYSAVLLLYGAMEKGDIPKNAPVRTYMEEAAEECAKLGDKPFKHTNEQINYHISMGIDHEAMVWPDLEPSWNGDGRCVGGDRAIFRRLSAADVAAAVDGGARDILCGRLVIIGGTNMTQADFLQTPLDEMAGPAIIANAVRGLQLNGGGMRKLSLPLQILVLIPVAAGISAGFAFTRQTRREYKRWLRRNPEGNFWLRLRALPFNPVVLNWTLALVAHYVGVALLLWSLGWGLWGFLSAPAFASAVAETAQEFADDELFTGSKRKTAATEEAAAAEEGVAEELPPEPEA